MAASPRLMHRGPPCLPHCWLHGRPCWCLWEEALSPRPCEQSCLPARHAGLLLTPSLSRPRPEPSLPEAIGAEVLGAPFSLTAEEEPAAPSERHLSPQIWLLEAAAAASRCSEALPGWGSAPSGAGPGRARRFGAGGDHLNLEGSSHQGSEALFGYQSRRGRHGPGATTWPGLLGHCLTFFVPRAWVWYREKNQVAREEGGGGGRL